MSAGSVWEGSGVRAVEARLAEEVGALLEASRSEPRLCARPVRIVVPSRSLRLHVCGALLRQLGSALAGVSVETLEGLARGILERNGVQLPTSRLIPVAVRRIARTETALARDLDDLEDGYGGVAAGIDDLLDAGFDPALAEVLDERLAHHPVAGAHVDRARALVRVAVKLCDDRDEVLAGHRSRLFTAARELLERDPERVLPQRALFVLGLADATGVQTDLLAALVRLCDAHVLLDRPPDPVSGGGLPAGSVFGARFRERLEGAAAAVSSAALAPAPTPRCRVLRAPGRTAEARAVAERLRDLIDRGAQPERLAVVARDLSPYRLPLRRQLRRLGVPFSGLAEAGAAAPAGRWLGSLQEVLSRRESIAAEHWLDAIARLEEAGEEGVEARSEASGALRADLRHALHQLGAARLADVAALPQQGAGPVALAARNGLAGGTRGPGAIRRRLSGAALAAAARAAAATCRRLARWPEAAPLAEHARWLRDLAVEDLGWTECTPGLGAIDALLADASESSPALDLDRDEWLLVLRRALESASRDAFGGSGGGVQVLGVMEARARSFDQLFLVGMNRGLFPRVVSEDPLLPDELRRALRDVLPDLPVKREGHDEERFLFAQLLTSAPDVTLTLAVTDDDAAPLPVSPLLDTLDRSDLRVDTQDVPSHLAPRTPDVRPAAPWSAAEHALSAGVHATRDAYRRVFPVAVDEAQSALHDEEIPAVVRDLAPARLAVLAELEAWGEARDTLGPYFGYVGEPVEAADPRRGPLHVTALEATARCPWRAFLGGLLRIEPAPDALAALPTRGSLARLLGKVVHASLDRIAAVSLPPPGDDEQPLLRVPVDVAWPTPERVESIVHGCAEDALQEAGIPIPGFARVLARRAAAHLAIAHAVDWPAPASTLPVVGTELAGRLSARDAQGRPREIHFRADRVDRLATGLRFVDYKTGGPLDDAKSEAKRAEAQRGAVARGESLQAAAYALSEPGARGRYLYLRPDAPDHARDFECGAEDVSEPFAASLQVLLEARDRGSFVPRLRHPDDDEEPRACASCDVKEACLRGDSGARRRLGRFALDPGPASLGPAERALLAIWNLYGEPR
jgi:hypothetical protein